MPGAPLHHAVIRRQIIRTALGEDSAGRLKVLRVVGVDVLGLVCLDPVVPLHRQDDRGPVQRFSEVVLPCGLL